MSDVSISRKNLKLRRTLCPVAQGIILENGVTANSVAFYLFACADVLVSINTKLQELNTFII